MEMVTFTVDKGDADQVLHRTFDRLGGDIHTGKRGMQHDSPGHEVLPDRKLVLAETSLEVLFLVVGDIQDDPNGLHCINLF
jgi:hypothetical protein